MSVNVDPSNWRLKTISGVPYKLLSLRGGFEPEQAIATGEYLIRSIDLLAFTTDIFPPPYIQLGILFYPRRASLPGLPALLAQSLDWESFDPSYGPIDPFGADPADAARIHYYDFIKVSIDFATSPQNDGEQNPNLPLTFLEISAVGGGGYLTVPNRGGMSWLNKAGTQIEQQVIDQDIHRTVREATFQWTVRWPQIPEAYFGQFMVENIRSKLGKVNNEPMELLNDAPAQTMLFESWSARQEYTWRAGFTGESPLTVEFSFVEKGFISAEGVQVTHNHFFRPGIGYRKLLVDIDNNFTYASTDLDDMFKPAAR